MNADFYGNFLFACFILLSGAVIVPLFAGNKRFAGALNFFIVLAASLLFFDAAYVSIFQPRGGVFDIGVFSFSKMMEGSVLALPGGMKLNLLIDGLSGFFIGLISLMALASSLYSIRYMEHYHEYSVRSFYCNLPLFVLGMVLLVSVDDLSTGFAVAWQMMTISSFFLVRFEFKKRENTRAALKYLLLMELAWIMIAGGALLIPGSSFGEPVHSLSEKMMNLPPALAVIVPALLFAGFAFKAGVFPLGQLWLPDAHSVAPSPISALLSGVMLKTGIYGIIRTFFWMVPAAQMFPGPGAWGTVIASFGAATLFIGTVQSVKQNDMKRLLAYSSIGQIGYIVFAAGAALMLYGSPGPVNSLLAAFAFLGAMYHILNHAVFKGLLFLSSGSVLYSAGTKDLNRLGGLLQLMPATGAFAAVASLSISGVPPFSGFASKWTIIASALLSGKGAVLLAVFGIIALFTSAVTLACYVKFFGMTFTSTGGKWHSEKEITEVPYGMIFPKMVLACLCVVQGALPFAFFSFFGGVLDKSGAFLLGDAVHTVFSKGHVTETYMGSVIHGPFGGILAAAVPFVAGIVVLSLIVLVRYLRDSGSQETRDTGVWLCGYREQDQGNVYKGSDMFSAFISFFRWTGGNVKREKDRR